MVTALKVATYFIKKFNEVGEHISHLKLQKLLYYTDAWYRVFFKDELFREQPQAWVHGPVYVTVYRKYRDSGADNLVVDESIEDIKNTLPEIFENNDKVQFFNEIIEFYAPKSAFELENMTHNEEPWLKARKGYSFLEPCSERINMEEARIYYEKLIKDA